MEHPVGSRRSLINNHEAFRHDGRRSAEADLARRVAAAWIDEQEYERRFATQRRLQDH